MQSLVHARRCTVVLLTAAGVLLLAGAALGPVGRASKVGAQVPCPPPTTAPTPSPAGYVNVCYAPGWNLVGGPATFPVPLWIWNATSNQYTMLPAGSSLPTNPGVGGETNGQGAWAYFTQTTSTTVYTIGPGGTPVVVGLAAGQWQQIGYPFSSGGGSQATVCGPIAYIFTYDAVVGTYNLSTTPNATLKPGQGAWA
jgi:hypothetical protein